MMACKSLSLALIYYSYIFFCISLDEIDVIILLACIMYEAQLAVKCTRVSIVVRMKSLKNWGIALVEILAITLFLICENVISTMSKCIKFLPSLFFLISSNKSKRRSAGAVKRRER
jgi:hypothetical protein